MELSNLKRWHWIVIGLLVGLAMAYSRLWMGTDGIDTKTATISQARFEWYLSQEPRQGYLDSKLQDFPRLTDIVVYPSDEGTYVVKMWVRDDDYPDNRKIVYKPFRMNTDTPYQESGMPWMGRNPFQSAAGGAGADNLNGEGDEGVSDEEAAVAAAEAEEAKTPLQRLRQQVNKTKPGYTVLDYLKEKAAADERVQFRYAWWKEPWAIITTWTVGSVLLIGGVWPTLIALLVGAGFGRPPKDPAYDLSRFGKGQPEPAKAQASGLTDTDLARLEAMEEALIQDLEADAATRAEEPRRAAGGPAPVRALDGGPAEPMPAAAPGQHDEHKEYRGEFYPVAKPVHHENGHDEHRKPDGGH